jgi:CHASE2 domain-containing sensor protein
VKAKALTQHPLFRPALGAALTALCGLVLLTKLGDQWANASYDYLFRFGARSVTNSVVLILLDTDSYSKLHQDRREPWDRALHAQLLNRLADDGCPLVVMDALFRTNREPKADQALAEALGRQRAVALMAKQANTDYSEGARSAQPNLQGVQPVMPAEVFLNAARTNWGIAFFDWDLDRITRRHWPFPSPGPHQSLAWTAARLAGATLEASPEDRWLRYYGSAAPWATIPYYLALTKAPGYFGTNVVFIGNKPETALLDEEKDKFRPPYTRWGGEAVGGVELHATAFLNLVNGDWLRRPHWALEVALILLIGAGLGFGLCRVRPLPALGVGALAALAALVAGVCLSYFTNFWVPWLIVLGGQIPCALAWSLAPAVLRREARAPAATLVAPVPAEATTIMDLRPNPSLPDVPDYDLFDPPFGEGGFGKVWLARNAIGQWQALKAVYAAKFGGNPYPYEAEFNGIQRYKPVSEKHPGLLRIELVSKKKSDGYFYYVMELGDALDPGWEQTPATYKPRDLESLRKQSPAGRLSAPECLRIGAALAEALDFLHRQGLTHRDIKPSNVIFVRGQPKLADVGLVADIRPPELVKTYVGTAGYLPPAPERAGTVQADIFALGMVLYVISTGRGPDFFPTLSATLMEASGHADFIRLNAIILKACHPDCALRYQATAEMLRGLHDAQASLRGVIPALTA